jgi:hypothetical protein
VIVDEANRMGSNAHQLDQLAMSRAAGVHEDEQEMREELQQSTHKPKHPNVEIVCTWQVRSRKTLSAKLDSSAADSSGSSTWFAPQLLL